MSILICLAKRPNYLSKEEPQQQCLAYMGSQANCTNPFILLS